MLGNGAGNLSDLDFLDRRFPIDNVVEPSVYAGTFAVFARNDKSHAAAWKR